MTATKSANPLTHAARQHTHNCSDKYVTLTSMSGLVYACISDKLCMCVGVQFPGRKISTMCHIVMGTIRGAINTTAALRYVRMSARHFLSPFLPSLLSLYLTLIELFTGTFASDEEKHYAWMKGGGLEGIGGWQRDYSYARR